MQNKVYTFEEYDKMCDIFDQMKFKAGEYVPPDEIIERHIAPDLETFIPYLLWLDETCTETEENRESILKIRELVKENVAFSNNKLEIVKRNYDADGHVLISYSTYDELCSLFDKMDLKAEDYTPSEEQMYDNLLPSIRDSIIFFLWVEETGYHTDVNQENRKIIQQIIKDTVKFVPDEDAGRLDKELLYRPCIKARPEHGKMVMYNAFCDSYAHTLRLKKLGYFESDTKSKPEKGTTI